MMDRADSPREGDFDGRGNLSRKALVEFTQWFLEYDQIDIVRNLSATAFAQLLWVKSSAMPCG
jgi:hypothetical protein